MASKTGKKKSSKSKKSPKNDPPRIVGMVSNAVRTMKNQTEDAVMEAWDDLEEERRREILALPLIAFSLICFLSLISHNPADLAAADGGGVSNWIGRPGAWLANVIINVFGATGFALPALFFFWGIDRIQAPYRRLRKIRIFGFILMLVSLSTGLGILSELTIPPGEFARDERVWRAGGAVGFAVGRRLLEFGPMGALIVCFTLFSLALLLCTPFLFVNAFHRILEFLFPSRYADDEDVEEVEAEECGGTPYEFKPLPERKSAKSLPPMGNSRNQSLYEWDGGDWDPEPEPCLTMEKRESEALPSLSDYSSPPDGDGPEDAYAGESARGKELKIVTSEDEKLEEVNLGVNLVKTPENVDYQLPPISLLQKPDSSRPEVERGEIIHNSMTLERSLGDFNIPVKVVEVNYGPTITCYELEPAPGIKISRIENLAGDITRALKASTVRIEAPIPGKGTVGVEVPNRSRSDVYLREIIGCESYQSHKSKLKVGMGKTISGEPFVFDLIRAPHLLVAGATGSGKSVCINTIITSFLYNAAPHEVKLLMVDPKQVELALYRDIPHLLSPVITDPKKAGAALRWAVEEMETRYRYLKKAGVRNIGEFNKKRMAQQEGKIPESESSLVLPGFLPYIVIIIDELADLMMIVRAEVEATIARLAAMARAVGLHLVLATQRPSVDVLTGVIKNNFPSRIAFQVSAVSDSRTILDSKGAETLLGRGDMLFSQGGANRPIRLQCSYISTEEVEDVVDFVKAQQDVEYVREEFIPTEELEAGPDGAGGAEEDDMYEQALQVVLENDSASTSLLQRRLKIGYGRAARLIDLMEENGVVGPPRGSRPREIVLNKP